MARALKPKPAVHVASVFVSQLTCTALLAVDERRYLEAIVPLCAGHVTRLGKLRLVPLDVAVAKLRELAKVDDAAAANDVDEDEAAEPADGDAVLARLGLRRAAGSSR